jgi:hypothetical protein
VSPCHSRQPSVISDASAAEGDRSSTPSDINSPRHRTHSLCNVRPAAVGPGHLGPAQTLWGQGTGGRYAHCLLLSTQGAPWRRLVLVCSFLLQEAVEVGRERNEARLLLVSGRARKIQRKAGLGRPQGLCSLEFCPTGPQLGGPCLGLGASCPRGHLQSSGPDQAHLFPLVPVLTLQLEMEPTCFVLF